MCIGGNDGPSMGFPAQKPLCAAYRAHPGKRETSQTWLFTVVKRTSEQPCFSHPFFPSFPFHSYVPPAVARGSQFELLNSSPVVKWSLSSLTFESMSALVAPLAGPKCRLVRQSVKEVWYGNVGPLRKASPRTSAFPSVPVHHLRIV